jgi:predicted Zn-dependent protease with MMP-like domain
MQTGQIEDVSDTALMVAAYRAIESKRADALFRDLLAAKLAGSHGEEIVRHRPRWSPPRRSQHYLRKRRLLMPSGQIGTREDFEAAVQAIWDGLPEQFRAVLSNVTVHVADFADAETLKTMHISDPYDLLGLYHGVGLPFKSVLDPASLPDRIFLYRIPILSYARRNGEPMDRVIRHVLIHEIGHHFGFSDADMALIESRR